MIVGFGNCHGRLQVARFLRERGFLLATAVHPRATVAADVSIGAGSDVGRRACRPRVPEALRENDHIQNQEYNGWRLNVVKILCQGFGSVRQARNWDPLWPTGQALYEVKDV